MTPTCLFNGSSQRSSRFNQPVMCQKILSYSSSPFELIFYIWVSILHLASWSCSFFSHDIKPFLFFQKPILWHIHKHTGDFSLRNNLSSILWWQTFGRIQCFRIFEWKQWCKTCTSFHLIASQPNLCNNFVLCSEGKHLVYAGFQIYYAEGWMIFQSFN